MPTVARFDGLRVVIYPNDHRPAHVHVTGQGGDAVFILNCPGGPADLRESFGYGQRDLSRIAAAIQSLVAGLCAEWRMIHGDQ